MASGQDAGPGRMEPVNANSFEAEPAPAETETPQPQQEGVVQPGGAVAAPVPQPRYDEGDEKATNVIPHIPFTL